MKLNKLKQQKGFTIIEVMIVLAIAGLIMVIVFLAVPQLQRSQRNTTRKDMADRIKTEVDSYSSNNSGALPAALAACAVKNFGNATCGTGFFARYLGCPGVSPNWCSGNINDPKAGVPLGTGGVGQAGTTTYLAAGLPANAQVGSVNYALNTICDGEAPTAVNASARNYTVQVALEGGAFTCLDNH